MKGGFIMAFKNVEPSKDTGFDDKQVGELWLAACKALDNDGICTLWAKATINLIRKLVEERELFEGWTHGEYCVCESDKDFHRRSALSDFGIDPKEYNG